MLLSNVAKVTLPCNGKPLLETETNYLQIKLSYATKANFKFWFGTMQNKEMFDLGRYLVWKSYSKTVHCKGKTWNVKSEF